MCAILYVSNTCTISLYFGLWPLLWNKYMNEWIHSKTAEEKKIKKDFQVLKVIDYIDYRLCRLLYAKTQIKFAAPIRPSFTNDGHVGNHK